MVLLLRGLNLKFTYLNFPVVISNKSCLVLGDEVAVGVCYLPLRWNLPPVNFHSWLYLQKLQGKKKWFLCPLWRFWLHWFGGQTEGSGERTAFIPGFAKGITIALCQDAAVAVIHPSTSSLTALQGCSSAKGSFQLLYPWSPTKGSSMVLFCLCPGYTFNHPRICITSPVTYWLEHYIALVGEGGSTLGLALGY